MLRGRLNPLRVLFDGFSGDVGGFDVRFVPASTAPGRRRCVWPNASDGKAVVDLRQTGLGPGPLVGFPKTADGGRI